MENTNIIKTISKENPKKKKAVSKYDIVKVKVYLDQHFFVFSRYLLANILRVIKIPFRDAQKISSDIKRFLVENNLLELQQSEFQKYVFETMRKYKFEDVFKERYIMMNQFYSKRVPLLILISGTLCIGKSNIATKLSERMNIGNVLQTKIVSDVMGSIDKDYSFKPFWIDENVISDEDLIKSYQKECKIIRKGVNFDIQKTFVDGKALIIEGHHVIPKLYVSKESDEMRIITPGPDDVSKEKEREKAVREEMKKISQKGLVIPFLLTSDEKNHTYCVNSGIFFEGENVSDNENDEKKRIRLQILLNKFRTIQDYLVKNSGVFVLKEIDLDNTSKLIEQMHDYILQKIEETYQNWSN